MLRPIPPRGLIAQHHWMTLIPSFAAVGFATGCAAVCLPAHLFLLIPLLAVSLLIGTYMSWQAFRIQISSTALTIQRLSWRGRELTTIPIAQIQQLRISYAPFSKHLIGIHIAHHTGAITYRLLVVLTAQHSP